MATVEELEILIDVIDRFSRQLDQLIIKLAEVEAVAERVDRIDIDVNVDDRQLDTLLAKMGAAQVGDVAVGRMGGGGAAGAATAAAGRGGDLDNLDDAARDATQTLTKFASETDDTSHLLNLRMTDMHNALAKLVPILFVIIGALPALITAFVAVAAAAIAAAAALAAITGLGALGFAIAQSGVNNLGKGIKKAVKEVVNDFLDAFAPLAERLTPLFKDALDGLDRLFQAVANRGDALMDLADEARGFGQFLLEFIPNALENMARMAEAFGPLFAQLGDFLLSNSLLQFLTEFMADALPAFMEFINVLLNMLPTLLRVSIGFLNMFSVILRILDGFGRLIGLLGIGEEAFGLLVAAVLTAWTAMNLFSLSGIMNAITAIATLVPRVLVAVGAMDIWTASALAAALSTSTLALAIAALIGVVTLGVGLVAMGAAATFVADEFFRTADGIDAATSSLREFDRVSARSSSRAPESGVRPGSVAASRFMGGGGNTSVRVEVDNRGRDREDADAQTDRAFWKAKKMSGNSSAGNTTGK